MVVFACSLGMDMEFNSSHHQEKTASSASHHHEEEIHHHENKTSKSSNHHHEKEVEHHENDADSCCKDEAVKFAKADKLSPQTSYTEINPVFFPAILTGLFSLNILDAGSNVFTNKFFVLGHHPPIPDIRIAIQSFQI
ncbi:hypothetical protein [Pedobacter cryophilus]|nr:hypothetical protein [Pedobacter cryophilus]